MGGKGSGGHNRKSLEELRLRGAIHQARHLVGKPSPEEVVRFRRGWRRFLKRLEGATLRARPHPLDHYAQAIVNGERPAGKYHRLACARHLRDRAREATPGFPYRLDDHQIARFLAFSRATRHYKGSWAGRPIRLQPYQVFRLGSMFGWIHTATGLRRFRRAYHELPRKNGKSLEAALVALYTTFFCGEGGAEGYCTATKKAQAHIVWDDAAAIVKTSILKMGIDAFAHNLSDPKTMSKLEPLGADADSLDGLNPSLIIQDEFHAQKNRKMIDVLETATGARTQPMDMRITTAGDDLMSPCGDEHAYACQVLEEILTDESYFAFIAHADPEDLDGEGWRSEATARKANPNYGVSVLPKDLADLAHKARHMPAAAAAYQQKRLNVWVNTATPWLSIEGWRQGQTRWTADELRGESCYIGIDLSSKIDLSAVTVLFPPTDDRKSWRILPWCLTPDDTLEDRAHRDHAPYPLWKEQGYLKTCPGSRIDQDVIYELVQDALEMFHVEHIGVDPWNAGNLMADLTRAGCAVVEVPQTLQQMSAPCKDFEADVLQGLIDAGGHPLMGWAIANVVVQRDGKDNIYPVKKKSRGRIDPVIAALIARKLAMMDAQAPPPPSYKLFVLGGGR